MIITVFVTDNSDSAQWQAELLEDTWRASGQPGELLRLVAQQPGLPLPLHALARVEQVLPWENHPYMADHYSGYTLPAALLEWLLREQTDATVLLLESDSLLRKPIVQELEPGAALAAAWEGKPAGDGPFGLPIEYQNLQAYCINRELVLPQVQLPLLIHSRDLLQLAPRWLELTAMIRHDVIELQSRPRDAVKLAYTIAASEYATPHKIMSWRSEVSDDDIERPVFSYQDPVETGEGRILFDSETDTPTVQLMEEPASGAVGREFLGYLTNYGAARTSGASLRWLRPMRRPGVREARVMEQCYLEVGSPARSLNLNPSATAIWNLCDGERTLFDVAQELQDRYQVPMDVMAKDVEQTAMGLRIDGAIELEKISQ